MKLCSCPTPVPVQQASHKGASTTTCSRCGKPLPLSLGSVRRA
jgi:hypothetical protein